MGVVAEGSRVKVVPFVLVLVFRDECGVLRDLDRGGERDGVHDGVGPVLNTLVVLPQRVHAQREAIETLVVVQRTTVATIGVGLRRRATHRFVQPRAFAGAALPATGASVAEERRVGATVELETL